MNHKVTKQIVNYPEGQKPDYIEPVDYRAYRFALGRKGTCPLVAICMNPSAAQENTSDRTINRIISISRTLNMDGWIVFNTYPERATDAGELDPYNEELCKKNLSVIKKYLQDHKITEVWGAWGDDKNNKTLMEGKKQLKTMLKCMGVKVYYFGTLTKMGNPRHPIQRQERWDFTHKKYL